MESHREPLNRSKTEEVAEEEEEYISRVSELLTDAHFTALHDVAIRDGDFTTGELIRITGGQQVFIFDILWDMRTYQRSHVFPLSKYTQLLPDLEIVRVDVGDQRQFRLASVFSEAEFDVLNVTDFEDLLHNIKPLSPTKWHSVKIHGATEARTTTEVRGHIKYCENDLETGVFTFRFLLTCEPDEKNHCGNIRCRPPQVAPVVGQSGGDRTSSDE